MTFVTELATIAIVLLLACISPGPDFVAVTSHALASRRAGLRVAFGVAAAIIVWAIVTVVGLALVLAQIDGLYHFVRLAGAAYLVYLGVHLIVGAWRAPPSTGAVAAGAPAQAGGASIRRGFVIGITNPKSAAFFSSLFATVLPAGAPGWVYGATVLIAGALALGWFSLLAIAFSAGVVQRVYRRARRGIDALMGAALSAIGLELALFR